MLELIFNAELVITLLKSHFNYYVGDAILFLYPKLTEI